MSKLIYDSIKLQGFGRIIDLKFNDKITLLDGDSGVGKSLIFQLLSTQRKVGRYSKVNCINSYTLHYTNATLESLLKNISKSFVAIDNADILLDANTRHLLCVDSNQYLVIGRNPDGLFVDDNSIAEVNDDGKVLSIVYPYRDYIKALDNCFGMDMSMIP